MTNLPKRPLEILLVEDDPADASLTIDALRHSAVENHVCHVADGEAAAEHLRGASPDLIILDLNLPRKDGRELLRELKADPARRTIPVAIFTTSSSEQEIQDAYSAYANCYVCKPVGLDEYLARVQGMTSFWYREATLPPFSRRQE
ncbi:MAG: response regulator [Terriglobales bacterium]